MNLRNVDAEKKLCFSFLAIFPFFFIWNQLIIYVSYKNSDMLQWNLSLSKMENMLTFDTLYVLDTANICYTSNFVQRKLKMTNKCSEKIPQSPWIFRNVLFMFTIYSGAALLSQKCLYRNGNTHFNTITLLL